MGTVTALGSRNYLSEDGFSSQTREASTEIISKDASPRTTSPTEVVQALASQANESDVAARPKGTGPLADSSEPQRTSPITEQRLEKQSFAQQPGESDNAYYWRMRDALSHWRPSPPTDEAIQAKLGESQQMKQAIRDNPNFSAWRQGLKPEAYNNPTAHGGREPRDPFKDYTRLPLGGKTAQDAWIAGGYAGNPFERIAADGRVYFFSPSSDAYAPNKGPVGLEAEINENIGKLNDVLRMRSGQASEGPPPTEWQSTSPSAPLYDERQMQPLYQPMLPSNSAPIGQSRTQATLGLGEKPSTIDTSRPPQRIKPPNMEEIGPAYSSLEEADTAARAQNRKDGEEPHVMQVRVSLSYKGVLSEWYEVSEKGIGSTEQPLLGHTEQKALTRLKEMNLPPGSKVDFVGEHTPCNLPKGCSSAIQQFVAETGIPVDYNQVQAENHPGNLPHAHMGTTLHEWDNQGNRNTAASRNWPRRKGETLH